jgi:glycosyltransferase involved in cell wall biosynthesis
MLFPKYGAESGIHFISEPLRGVSNVRNRALRECGTEWIAFLDDDAIAEPDWLERILGTIREHDQRAHAIGGRVVPIWEAPRPPWLPDSLLGMVSIVDWGGECRVAKENEWFAGANISFRVSAMLAAGGFKTLLGRQGDERLLISNEEIEMIRRLRSLGGLAIYDPKVTVRHRVPPWRLSREWFRRRMAWQATSDMLVNPGAMEADLPAMWSRLLSYIAELPPRDRGLKNFWIDTDDPALFSKQIHAIYSITACLLSGRYGEIP